MSAPADVRRHGAAGRWLHPAALPAVALVCFVVLLSPGLARDDAVHDLLQGPDDFMRLVQVRDLVDGQAWFDLVQHRLDPPRGVAMHWSRLGDIPLALVAALAQPWVGRDDATRLAVLVVPALLGGAFLAAFCWAAAPLAAKRPLLAAALMAAALVVALTQFRTGRIDHHGLQLVFAAVVAGCLLRCLPSGGARPAAAAGSVAAASLAVGLDALPLVAVVGLVLGIAAVLHRRMALPFAAFGLALAGTLPVLCALTAPSSAWAVAVCDRASVVHMAGAGVVAVAGVAAVVLARTRAAARRWARLLAVGGVGLAGLAGLAAAFPQCAGDPYATLAPVTAYWFEGVNEARSLVELYARSPGRAVAYAVLPAAAVLYAAGRFVHGPRDLERFALLALAVSGLAVLVWQIRAAPYANLVAALALVPLAGAVDVRAQRLARLPARLALRLGIPATCAVAVGLPAALDGLPGEPRSRDHSACDVARVRDALADPDGLGAARRTIAAPIDAGPAILLLSPHAVLAAPYHRNARGFADNRLVFAGTEAEARSTIAVRGVDAVLFCAKYAGLTDFDDRPAFLDSRLAADRPPAWLVPVSRQRGVALYRVDPGPAPRDGL